MTESNFEYARAIGEKLRGARRQRHLSLRELARKSNISASMLSQIETGKAYPSVRSIYTIAEALGLPVDYFFPEQNGGAAPQAGNESSGSNEMTAGEMHEASFNRSAALQPLEAVQVLHLSARPMIQLKGGVLWSRLTAAAETNVEFLEVHYVSGASSGTNLSQHEGREFGLILEGELLVELGFKRVTLQEGASIVFDSTTPHRLTNKGSAPMRAFWVVWNSA